MDTTYLFFVHVTVCLAVLIKLQFQPSDSVFESNADEREGWGGDSHVTTMCRSLSRMYLKVTVLLLFGRNRSCGVSSVRRS